jgi:hypothetical protein
MDPPVSAPAKQPPIAGRTPTGCWTRVTRSSGTASGDPLRSWETTSEPASGAIIFPSASPPSLTITGTA